jgi:cytidine deaminase
LPQNTETVDRPELIFALVGAAGVRLDDLSIALKQELISFGYRTVDIRLSDLLRNFTDWVEPDGASEFERVRHLQKIGDELRDRLKDGCALALAGVTAIREKRASISGSPDRLAWATAYIVRQLKHPDEVELLRKVYGSAFLLVAGHAPRKVRLEALAEDMAGKACEPGQGSRFEAKASDIIEIDENEASDFGQNTRDTYPKADFFANMGHPLGQHEVRRFVDLLFGHPFHTPTPEEYAMYQAHAVSLRSSDDSRQVGAVIVSLTRDPLDKIRNADVIAVGMNEVPRGGGGFYWDQDSPDNRDQNLRLREGGERATKIKISALAELIDRISQEGWLKEAIAKEEPSDLARILLPSLRRTQFLDIGEFSRPVHAEMATLIDAARRGVAVHGHSMYVTTFPCHNCAKHIIAAGLQRVVYLEPYPKSRARNLYGEEIVWESMDGKVVDGKVVFCAFSGIAPRQYGQLFSMTERGKKNGTSLKVWQEESRLAISPRYVMRNADRAYIVAERTELEKLPSEIYRWDRETVCPSIVTAAGANELSDRSGIHT